MIEIKKSILASFAVGSLALSWGALAADQPGMDQRDDVRFECKFREESAGKGHDDDFKCRAEGQLDPRKLRDDDWVVGDRDDFLKVECRDDDHGSDEQRIKILYGRHHEDLIITGGKTTSPVIVVKDIDQFEGERRAKLLLQERNKMKKLEGECRFDREHHNPMN